MRVAATDGKILRDIVIAETPRSFEDGVKLLTQLATQVSLGKKIERVCGGIAASLDLKKEKLFRAPNLPRWEGKNFVAAIRKNLKVKKVILENDTALVGLGEALYGAGKKHPIVVYITMSTGINGVRIVDGRIDQSAMGFEIGHQIIGDDVTKTLEYFSGAASLARRHGVEHAENITDNHAWSDAEKHIAIGIHNTLLYWSPNIVVLGGGSIMNNRVSLKQITEKVKMTCKAFPKIPAIKKAQLDDLGGIYGALALLNQKKLV